MTPMRFLRTLATPLVTIALVTATATSAPAATEPPRPAFYEAPATLPAGNGTVIRSEAMTFTLDPLKTTSTWLNASRVLYTSTGRTGNRIAVSGTVLVPKAPWFGFGSRPIIGYAPGTQGMADRCAPSRMQSDAVEYESLFIQGLLQRGYAVAMTDYQGLGTAGIHQYMNRHVQGTAVLDMIRAAQRLSGAGLSTSSPVGISGYSQGGGAAASAAELAPTYAPELRLKGVVAGAVPADLGAVSAYIDGTTWTAFELYAVRGLADGYGSPLSTYLNDTGLKVMDEVEAGCVFDLGKHAFLNTATLTTSGRSFPQMLGDEPFKSILADNLIGNRKPAVPVLISHSALDDTIPYAVGKQLAKRWCAKGTNVYFSTNLVATHLGGMLATTSEQYAFFEARFAGLPQWSNCWTL